ncbi:MAG: hypothetical protein JWP97_356 [Labilithrix sp.]|nr:hypothetical protein [Labilithrix sp.]
MNQPPDVQQRFERFVGAQREVAPTAAGLANRALVQRYFDMWNSGDPSVADQVLAPTYFDHAHPEVLGPAAFRSLVPRFRAANPGAVMTLAFEASDADFVAVRNTIAFVHEGRPATVNGLALFRALDGKLVEQWSWYGRSALDTFREDARKTVIDAWLFFRA